MQDKERGSNLSRDVLVDGMDKTNPLFSYGAHARSTFRSGNTCFKETITAKKTIQIIEIKFKLSIPLLKTQDWFDCFVHT
jgi:hypothetical protein